jgi:hypothetical protein
MLPSLNHVLPWWPSCVLLYAVTTNTHSLPRIVARLQALSPLPPLDLGGGPGGLDDDGGLGGPSLLTPNGGLGDLGDL